MSDPVARSAPVPALLLGGSVTALAVLRCLARARVEVFGATETSGFVTRSRWYRPLAGALPESGDPAPLASFLGSLALPRAVLMPCSDNWARAAARLPPEIAARFPASLSSPEVVETFVDKARFARLVSDLALPRPRTYTASSVEELDGVPPEILRDALLKPVDSQLFARRFGLKAFRIHDLDEARACLERATSAGVTMLVQEYIPGPPTAHYLVDGFVDRQGQLCACVVRQRLRMHPPELANSSASVTVPASSVAEGIEALRRLMTAVGFRGVFGVELKRDARDGTLRLIELNPRLHTWVEFAATCGPDVCVMAYRDALGAPVEPQLDYAVGRRAYWLPYDFDACRALHRAGRLSLWSWLREWMGSRELAFSWDDPVPAVVNLRDARRERLERRPSRPEEAEP